MMKPTEKFVGLRTYTVIPGTVQTPIKIMMDGATKRKIAGRFENTRDVIQSAGRQCQQGAHVRGMLENHLALLDAAKLRGRKISHATVPYNAITGITKKCRDSFELIHVKNLLEAANIRYFEFEDTQEDEYENEVTALITEPVTPFAVAGILDYLPLWDGK